MGYLDVDRIYCGDSRELLKQIKPDSIALSVWSPPYHVGKEYEKGMTYNEWKSLLSKVIALHSQVLKPGGFLAINISDIICFKDEKMPKIMAENISHRKVSVTREQIMDVWGKNAGLSRKQIAKLMGCSEQTIDRRVNGNNVRGGKYGTQTRVNLTGGLVENLAYDSSLYLYDRRVWVKDPAWENSKWHTISYRAVDEFEYVYIFWKPGITTIDRDKLSKDEWINWGSRAVWNIASVRANNDHEAKFPIELPRRLIRLLTDEGDTVLDCFIGSGTSAAAAIIENRRFIGIDKEEKYAKLAEDVCRNTKSNKDSMKNKNYLDAIADIRPADELTIADVFNVEYIKMA